VEASHLEVEASHLAVEVPSLAVEALIQVALACWSNFLVRMLELACFYFLHVES
jgi:hypothetical protein